MQTIYPPATHWIATDATDPVRIYATGTTRAEVESRVWNFGPFTNRTAYRLLPATKRLVDAVVEHGGGPSDVRWSTWGESGSLVVDLMGSDHERMPAPHALPSQHEGGAEAPAPWHAGEDWAAIFDANARRILDVGRSRAHLTARIVRAVNAFELPSAPPSQHDGTQALKMADDEVLRLRSRVATQCMDPPARKWIEESLRGIADLINAAAEGRAPPAPSEEPLAFSVQERLERIETVLIRNPDEYGIGADDVRWLCRELRVALGSPA